LLSVVNNADGEACQILRALLMETLLRHRRLTKREGIYLENMSKCITQIGDTVVINRPKKGRHVVAVITNGRFEQKKQKI